MRSFLQVLVAWAALAALVPAYADKFENSYVSFNLPDGWKCKREETEFVCTPPNPSGKGYAAMMILAAKEPGPDDTLAAYVTHLGKDPPASGQGSLVKPPVRVNVQGTLWIDATLLGSEVPNYYTRYMATIKDDVAVLYTFSVHKTRYEELAGALTLAVQTLQVRARAQQGRP